MRSTTFLFIPRNISRLKSLLSHIFIPTFPANLQAVFSRIHVCIKSIECKSIQWDQNLYEVAQDLSVNQSNGFMASYQQYQFVPSPVVEKVKVSKKEEKKTEYQVNKEKKEREKIEMKRNK